MIDFAIKAAFVLAQQGRPAVIEGEPDWINLVFNGGAFGILVALLVLGPKWIRESREHTTMLMKSISDDRHSDRNTAHQVLMTYQLELKEQREHDDAKWDKIVAVLDKNSETTAAALFRLEESNRNLASAIKEIGKHTS